MQLLRRLSWRLCLYVTNEAKSAGTRRVPATSYAVSRLSDRDAERPFEVRRSYTPNPRAALNFLESAGAPNRRVRSQGGSHTATGIILGPRYGADTHRAAALRAPPHSINNTGTRRHGRRHGHTDPHVIPVTIGSYAALRVRTLACCTGTHTHTHTHAQPAAPYRTLLLPRRVVVAPLSPP